jgi:hypothetical protein
VVDFVFAVDDPYEWHRANMRLNPSHYAPHLRALGGWAVAALADGVGAGVHYNTLIPWTRSSASPVVLGLRAGDVQVRRRERELDVRRPHQLAAHVRGGTHAEAGGRRWARRTRG